MPLEYHHLYDVNALGKAYELVHEGAVEIISNNEHMIKARVQGSKSYSVEVALAYGKISNGICSCPHNVKYCKHIAAMLLYLDEEYLKKMNDRQK